MSRERIPLQVRFEEKFTKTKTGCWIWEGAKRDGYGVINAGGHSGKTLKAHRVSYELYVGEIPRTDNPYDSCILHRCDVPSCVNPRHLFLGTQADNMNDKLKKGRDPRGEDHRNSKLSERDVLMIRVDQRLQREIAQDYGISQSRISSIKAGRTWSHLPTDLDHILSLLEDSE